MCSLVIYHPPVEMKKLSTTGFGGFQNWLNHSKQLQKNPEKQLLDLEDR